MLSSRHPAPPHSRLDPTGGFPVWDMHTTEHKFMTLVQADGLGQIENSGAGVDQGDFFAKGMALTPKSNPNTNRWDGDETGIWLTDIGAAGDTIEFTLAVVGPSGSWWQARLGMGMAAVCVCPCVCTGKASTV